MKQSGKWVAILPAIIYICLGIYLFANPLLNLTSLSYLFAFGVLMGGFTELFLYFSIPKQLRSGWKLFSAIVTTLVGFYLIGGVFITLPFLIPAIIGIWVLLFGIGQVFHGLKYLKDLPLVRNLFVWFGIINILLGLILYNHPLFASTVVAYLVAITFIYQGATSLYHNLKS